MDRRGAIAPSASRSATTGSSTSPRTGSSIPKCPSLSSIVLSFVDGTGAPHDPFLTLPDIYDMRLNADLVVLSACSTAEGRHVPGEGPIGLARAFMYAGAPRVVASLWRVNDSATAELMKRFYRGMLVEGLYGRRRAPGCPGTGCGDAEVGIAVLLGAVRLAGRLAVRWLADGNGSEVGAHAWSA